MEASPAAAAQEDDLRQRVLRTIEQVDALMQQRKHLEALAVALRDPPYTSSQGAETDMVKEVKEQAARKVLQTLAAFKEAELAPAVESLGANEQGALMKYLYKFWSMSLPPRTNAQLLAWHATLVESCGQGVIVQSIYDWNWP
eukprot:TRINITY_DN103813_c0_g1_i1.p1 TRINITY_DN103813_c0_g1~~TRINITY_DN103813_c0_g1_i1.p1  ORF type:complete len:143 (-),score=39.23 TRINITY_DN103813_c0_g1_i1:52-480(-)